MEDDKNLYDSSVNSSTSNNSLNEELSLNLSNNDEAECCKQCGNLEVEKGYLLVLCEQCRNELVARPIPIWIKATSLLLFLILIFALIRFPSSVQASIHYQRGIQSEKEHKYVTAVHNYELASKQFPDSTTILTRLFIAYFNNSQINQADQIYKKIAGREVSDSTLLSEVNLTFQHMEDRYFENKELTEISTAKLPIEKRISQLQDYIAKHPGQLSAQYELANTFYDMKDFNEAEKVLEKIRMSAPDFEVGSMLLSATFREEGKYDQAIAEVQNILNHNQESYVAYYELSKIEQKLHQESKALDYAKTSFQLNPSSIQVMTNLALTYHNNHQLKERDHIISLLKKRTDFSQKNLEQLESIFKSTATSNNETYN